MDVHAEQADERTLYQPLRHIASDDHRHHRPEDLRLQRQAIGNEAHAPGVPPEGRVDEVDAMIEHIAPPGGGDSAPGELAVDGLEHHEERSEEHTSELQSLMRISYAVLCLKIKKIMRLMT